MDGYIRVSRVAGRDGPAYISPSVQREAIEKWAAFRGVEIIAWETDEDESGGSQDRPGLRRIIDRIEAGETDGIACWRLNRFARNVGAAVRDVERVQAAGGHLAFTEEDIDPTGPFGSFILTILLAVATLERDNIKAGWETAEARAMERGVTLGPTPVGYRRREDSVLEVDPELGPVITEAYRLAATSGLAAARDHIEANVPSGDWSMSDARRSLGRRVYLGHSIRGDVTKLDTHPALTDRATWEAAQSRPQGRRAKVDYPLSGIATCASCGGPMVGSGAGAGLRSYRCARGRGRYRGEESKSCSAPASIVADKLESYVRLTLRAGRGASAWEVSDEPDDRVASAERTLMDAEAELQAFAADLTARQVLGASYGQHMRARADAVASAQAAYRSAAGSAARKARVPSAELYDTDDPAELRELFDAALGAVLVAKGRADVDSRVRLLGHRDDDVTGKTAPQDAALSLS